MRTAKAGGAPLFRIHRYLLDEALALGCRWQQYGRFGLLTNPKLDDPRFNFVRALGSLPLDLPDDQEDLANCIHLLAESGRLPAVVYDPSSAPPNLSELLTASSFAPDVSEAFMVLVREPGRPTPREVSIQPVGPGRGLQEYARLWSRIFEYDQGEASLVASEALVRVETVAAHTHYIVAVRGGVPVGTGGVRFRGGVAELLAIGTAPEVRRQGIGGALVQHLVRMARARRAEVIFLVVAHGSPAERLYARLGFQEVSAQQRWLRGR